MNIKKYMYINRKRHKYLFTRYIIIGWNSLLIETALDSFIAETTQILWVLFTKSCGGYTDDNRNSLVVDSSIIRYVAFIFIVVVYSECFPISLSYLAINAQYISWRFPSFLDWRHPQKSLWPSDGRSV